MSFKKQYFFYLSIFSLFLSFLLYFFQPEFLRILELKSFDLRLQLRGSFKTESEVVIVAVDEESIEKIGRWPWSRKTMAELVAAIDKASPKAVGYDIGFFEPENSLVSKELVKVFHFLQKEGKIDARVKDFFEKELMENTPDFGLAKTLAQASALQILGYYLNFKKTDTKELTPFFTAKYTGVKILQQESKFSTPKAFKLKSNLSLFLKAADKQAYFNVIPDIDGTYRRYPLVIAYGDSYLMPLALALFSKNKSSFLVVGKGGILGIEVGKKFIPTDEQGFLFLNYRGKAQSIPHIAAWELFTSKQKLSLLRNKYVIVGVTAPGVYDLRVTPFGVAYPGVEIQATALDNLLKGDSFIRPGFAPLLDLAIIIFLWFTVSVGLYLFSPFISLIFTGLLAFGFSWFNFMMLKSKLYLLNLTFPLLTLILTYILLLSYRLLFSDKQKRELRKAFSKYLDAKLVEKIVKEPELLKLGGEKRELTVLFSDIRGFTSLSEKLSPEQLVSLLNEYLTEMTQIILKHNGLLDKYIGDAIMAIFGTPVPYKEHASFACKSALKMLVKLEELNKTWENRLSIKLNIGIGINTGEMVAGNMGSIERFDYTVMGDNVNLASRLEGLNKYYGTNILVSESSYECVKEEFKFRLIDKVRVKGRKKPVKIYELLTEEKFEEFIKIATDYNEFLKDYFNGAFEQAQIKLEKIAVVYKDSVLDLYKQRLVELIANPPSTWDGVYTFEVK